MSQEHLPRHVAIIPDGNRRWAKNRNLEPWKGHEEGAVLLEKVAEHARDIGIEHLSIWGSSVENITKRPIREKKALLDIYEQYFERMLESESIVRDDVRISIIGRWREQFPERLVKLLQQVEEKTKLHTTCHLNVFLAYSGNDDMTRAVQSIVASGGVDVNAETIKKNLSTHALPPVDYLIRTGGEPHLSTGFMMWETADAQLYFTDALFPDFDIATFDEAIEEYARRARRHGA